MRANIKSLQEEIRNLPLEEGGNETGIAYITAYRFTTDKIQMPQTENPYLYIVLDGTLRLYTPSGIMDYMAGQYSVSKIDTPMSGTVLTFSKQQDFLALAVEFTPNDVISEILELDNELTERIMGQNLTEEEMSVSDNEVLKSVYRIFSVMYRTLPSDFIRKNVMCEVIYYTLCGTCSRQFLQSIGNIGKADEIYEANSWIKENFRNSFTVENLAEERNKQFFCRNRQARHRNILLYYG